MENDTAEIRSVFSSTTVHTWTYDLAVPHGRNIHSLMPRTEIFAIHHSRSKICVLDLPLYGPSVSDKLGFVMVQFALVPPGRCRPHTPRATD